MLLSFRDSQDGFYQTNVESESALPAWARGMRRATAEEIAANTPAPSATPVVVSMRQARLALLNAGLLSTVNATVAAMVGAPGEAARIEWEYSQEVRRDSLLVQFLAPTLGLTDTQLDQLFTTAATL